MVRIIGALLFGTVVLTTLLTPLVCDVLFFYAGALPFPFSRVFDRVALVVAASLFFLFRRHLWGTASFRKFMRTECQRWSLVLIALSVSLVSSLVVVVYYLSIGALIYDPRPVSYLLRKIPLLLPMALLIAVIEESFFRGILLRKLMQSWGAILSVVIVSILYALVHFIAPDKGFNYSSGAWLHGWSYPVIVVQGLINFEHLAPMMGLLLVGLVLAWSVLRSGSLTLAIGLHAGWIIGLKLVTYLTTWAPAWQQSSALARRYFIVGDWPGWLCVGLVGLWVYFYLNLRNDKN